jgi:hypothetical protein
MGLRGDMKLETLAGPKSIEELSRITTEEPNYTLPVVSWSGSRVFVVEAHSFRCIGEEQISAIELDDGTKVYMSASSGLMLRRGEVKPALELASDDSLLPLYTCIDRFGHPAYKEPKKKTHPIKFAILSAEWKLGRALEFGDYVKLIDKDKKNYHPNNLKIEHNKARATKSSKYKIIETAREIQALFVEWKNIDPQVRKRIEGARNHRVVSSELGPVEKVYTATLEGADVVAVAGVFAKLSCYET